MNPRIRIKSEVPFARGRTATRPGSPREAAPVHRRARASRILIVLAALIAVAMIGGNLVAGRKTPTPIPASGPTEYIAVPHRADAETRAKAGHAARSSGLPLISEPDVTDVERRNFK